MRHLRLTPLILNATFIATTLRRITAVLFHTPMVQCDPHHAVFCEPMLCAFLAALVVVGSALLFIHAHTCIAQGLTSPSDAQVE